MAESSQSVGPGGFVRSLPSPAPSSATTTRSVAGLPHPRGHALLPGSAKEDKVRRYVEDQLLHISRRYVKKFALEEDEELDEKAPGYKSLGELCKDVEALINILWLSGTPSLQIPYLLNIAGEFTEWLTHFRPSPTATFSLLRKLDHCFASLLSGHDIETNEPLPGFENGSLAGMSGTDKVRCKSLVERTRMLVVEVMSKASQEDEDAEDGEEAAQDTPVETDSEAESGASRNGLYDDDEEDDGLHMNVARVYENTLVQLGQELGEDQMTDI